MRARCSARTSVAQKLLAQAKDDLTCSASFRVSLKATVRQAGEASALQQAVEEGGSSNTR
ncbi:hypothetical protein RSO01_90280 [Reyranella soli]|uniref:Uncharacterized protein n=1 Tax=Reyranella soli TaxID=1230389 RepID=A0A512NSH4_9HYPH|nr:hypothetical protein RSO01_90280 [Reyranella soli]